MPRRKDKGRASVAELTNYSAEGERRRERRKAAKERRRRGKTSARAVSMRSRR